MRQALHIFRKDVRRLWPHIAIVMALFAFICAASLSNPILRGRPVLVVVDSFVGPFLMIGWLLLGIRVIHQEPVPGDDQFWLTRPYSRTSLLTAKIIFLLAFFYTPIVVTGAVADEIAGVPVLPNLRFLLFLCLARTVWIILAIIAIGSVTRNLLGFAGVTAAIIVAIAGYLLVAYVGSRWGWYGPTSAFMAPGIRNLAGLIPMLLLVAGAIGLEYHLRKTTLSRVLLGGAMILPMITYPADGVVTLSTRLTNPGFHPEQVSIVLDESQPPRFEGTERIERLQNARCESLALRVAGLPKGATLQSFGLPSITSESAPGDHSFSNYLATVEEADGNFREMVCFDDSFAKNLKGTPLTLRLPLGFTVWSVTGIRRVPLQLERFAVGGAGHCQYSYDYDGEIYCDLALPLFESLNAGVEFTGHSSYSGDFFSNPYSMFSPGTSRQITFGKAIYNPPSHTTVWPPLFAREHPEAKIVFRTERAIGFLQLELVYHGFRILDYPESTP